VRLKLVTMFNMDVEFEVNYLCTTFFRPVHAVGNPSALLPSLPPVDLDDLEFDDLLPDCAKPSSSVVAVADKPSADCCDFSAVPLLPPLPPVDPDDLDFDDLLPDRGLESMAYFVWRLCW